MPRGQKTIIEGDLIVMWAKKGRAIETYMEVMDLEKEITR